MQSSRSARLGSLSSLLWVSSFAMLCAGCTVRGRGPGAISPSPPATVGAADASHRDAASLDASASSSTDAASEAVAAGASEEITLAHLREALAWRAPAFFRVQRVVRQTGGLADEVSSGTLTLDAQGTVVWSLAEPALHLSIAGYEIRTKQTCVDARRSFSAEWLALAPLQPASTGDFHLYRVSGDGADVGYAAKPAEAYRSDRIHMHVVYRARDQAGLEVIVLQRWGSSRWRTFRYELRPADAGRASAPRHPAAEDPGGLVVRLKRQGPTLPQLCVAEPRQRLPVDGPDQRPMPVWVRQSRLLE
jgi:hypothetical protein